MVWLDQQSVHNAPQDAGLVARWSHAKLAHLTPALEWAVDVFWIATVALAIVRPLSLLTIRVLPAPQTRTKLPAAMTIALPVQAIPPLETGRLPQPGQTVSANQTS